MSKSNEQIQFHVSKGNQSFGPWTIEELALNLSAGVVAVTDFAYDEKAADWIPLFELAALRAHLQSAKPKKAPPQQQPKAHQETQSPTAVESKPQGRVFTAAPVEEPKVHVSNPSVRASIQASNEAEWYVQKGPQRFGPFTYLGVLQALQEKTVYEFDLIWTHGMDQWVRVAEHEAFQADAIRRLVQSDVKTPGIFAHRQYPRVKFESEVLAHDNRSVWLGHTFQASAGGSGLIIENATLVPGQSLILHFAAHDGLPSFNALCEVVSKKYSKEIKGAKTPVAYGVRFIQVEASAEAEVKKYFLHEKHKAENRKLVS